MVKLCYLCGASSTMPFVHEGEWEYLRCRRCGLVFLHPQPSEDFLEEHYQHYLPADPREIESWRNTMKGVVSKSASLIEDYIQVPGRLLDVGCGYGFFLDHMARRGWHVKGIEISATARRHAQADFRLEVSDRPLPRPDWPSGSFDVITLFYVLEHVKDPIAIIEEVRRLLRPGGILLLRVPHTTPIVRLLRPWVQSLKLYQAPSHLFDFNPRNLSIMLRKAGFSDIRTTICGYTYPKAAGARIASIIFGGIGESLARLSGDRLLLPGVSKTTVALRP